MAATGKKTKNSTQSDTDAGGFTAEERAAMKERAKETKGAKGRKKADGTADVLEKIAAMADADRVLAERLHELITKAAPELTPRTWYGMPAYARDGKVVCFFQDAGSSTPAMQPWASRTRPTSTRAPSGRRRLR